MVNPCKDCPDRHTACHDTCERYKAYKAELDAQRSYTYQMTHHQGVYHVDRMTHHQGVYHVDYRDKERDVRRKRCLFGQK